MRLITYAYYTHKGSNNQYSNNKVYKHQWARKPQLNFNTNQMMVNQSAPISMESKVVVLICLKVYESKWSKAKHKI